MDMISFLIIMVLGILPLITAIIMRKRNGKGIEAIEKILFIIGGNNINKGVASVFLCSFGIFFFLFYRLPLPLLILIYDLPFICLGGLEFSSKGKKGFWQFLIAAIVYLVLIAFAFMGLNSGEGDFHAQIRIWLSWLAILFWLFNLQILIAVFSKKDSENEKKKFYIDSICLKLNVLVAAGIAVLLIAAQIFSRMGYQAAFGNWELVQIFFSDPVHIINLYFLIIIFIFFYCSTGGYVGTISSVLLTLFLFFSNFIKLKYHNTFFNWFDLLQIKEMFLMGREFLTPKVLFIAVAIIVFAVGTFLLISKILKKSKTFRFSLCPLNAVFSFLIIVGLWGLLFKGSFEGLGIYARTWENESVNVQSNGLIVNQILNIENLKGAVMDRPEEYSKEMAEILKSNFQEEYIPTFSDIKPDVILILAESYFDLENVSGIEINMDIDETFEKYSAGTMISPRFGGYTSAIEFETLTGLSLAFLPNSLTPYTTYFNNKEDRFPSIVQEFNKNGYVTKAVHPNLPDFYNRTIVYDALGFQEYISIQDFEITEDNSTVNGWLKDESIGERIINELEKDEAPQFLFAITMEGHYVNVDKYEQTEVKLNAPDLNEKARRELEQQAQSYYNTNKMVGNLIDYMNNTDRPILLYVYGDHLPPIEALNQLGYTNDKVQKYGTGLAMYSNYKNISLGTEYITPNQIAAQIMNDSEIPHSSYFDYIYNLRRTYPIVHKEFMDIDNVDELDIYKFIQYDILFGNRWLEE